MARILFGSKLKPMNVLFLTCWYPDTNNPGLGVFIKEHAKSISSQPGIDLKVLQIWPQNGSSFYRKETKVFIDKNGIETHQVFIYSFGYKAIYLLNKLLNSIGLAYAKKKYSKRLAAGYYSWKCNFSGWRCYCFPGE